MHADYLRGRFPNWEIPRPHDDRPYMVRDYQDVGGDDVAVFMTPEEAFVVRSKGDGGHFITYDEYMAASVYYADHMPTRSMKIFRYAQETGKVEADEAAIAQLFDAPTINSIGHSLQEYHNVAGE
ncbi:hypothetical protein [Aneurinibacillus sp. REN35]|uniref:hypothetical protein n=1 Tax=Aneurinibacillus sp. REN35 TaxID=3237286 RepID=UPI0035295F0F